MPDDSRHPVDLEQEAYVRELPSYGPGWDAAVAFGIDMTLLLDNLALTPSERLMRLQRAADLHERLRAARLGED